MSEVLMTLEELCERLKQKVKPLQEWTDEDFTLFHYGCASQALIQKQIKEKATTKE